MPQYKIILRTQDGSDHLYIRHSHSAEAAVSEPFMTVVDGDFDNPVILDGTVVEVEEESIWAAYYCNDSEMCNSLKGLAEERGLKAGKGVGAFTVYIEGKGDWILEERFKPYLKLIRGSTFLGKRN
jgi:hypothetical protein